MTQITVELLRRFAGGRAKAQILDAIADHAADVFPNYGITSARRLQHFFAQMAHESGGFTLTVENHRYTSANLGKMWDSGNWRRYFPERADAVAMGGKGEKLLNIVYGGRMGNGLPESGDGFRYRGRGLAQITGKDGYAAVGKITGLPLVRNPELATSPDHMLECAAAFWKWKGLAVPADADNVVAVTKKWNGGTIGLAERRTWLAKAKRVFTSGLAEGVTYHEEELPSGEAPTPRLPDEEEHRQVEPVNSTSVETETVQRRLVRLGYTVGNVDGKWGGMTAGAIAAFKNDRGLSGEPVIDSALKVEITKAESEGFTRPIAKARAEAQPADIAKKVETVQASRTSKLWAWVLGIWGSIVAVFKGIVDNFQDAWSSPMVDAIREFASDNLLYIALGVVGIAGIIWYQNNKGETSAVQAYREGRLP